MTTPWWFDESVSAAMVVVAFFVGARAGNERALSRRPFTANPSPEPHGAVDVGRILADLRAGDAKVIDQAYRMTFGGQIGRFVLMHWMAQCGVGGRQGVGVSAEDRAYIAGRHDAAIDLMTTAGFDQPSAIVAALTETLGDPDHVRSEPFAYGATGIDPDTL